MEHSRAMQFKYLFEEYRSKLIYSQSVMNESFFLQRDEIPDEIDHSTTELETGMRLRLRNREVLFLKKLEDALQRINNGTFGQCECCGEEIEDRRLKARPMATHCIHCKEEQERKEELHRDGRRHKSLGFKLRFA